MNLSSAKNQILRWPTEKWKGRNTLVNKLTYELQVQHLQGMKRHEYQRTPIFPAEIMIIRQFDNYKVKPMDADNFAGGCKFLIDAIRHAKIIQDDNRHSALLHFHQIPKSVGNKTKCMTIVLIRKWESPETYHKEIADLLVSYGVDKYY